MLYYLSSLAEHFSPLNVFRYITFRAGLATVLAFGLCFILGPFFIRRLRQRSVAERAKREDCPDLDQFTNCKEGTPTMGGVFIIGSILVSVFVCADLSNPYVSLTMLTTMFLAVLGGIDDYVKLTGKDLRKRGLRGQTKFFWQILWACFIGSYIHFHPEISTRLDLPFLKDIHLYLGALYLVVAVLVIVGTSNAVNLTDGLDGLAIGCVLIVAMTLGILCYVTGHVQFSSYLLIPYVAGAGELTIICGAMVGASLGFLWFNSHPAEVFMGDVGSLSLGGTIGVMALFIKKELWLFILGGVFVIEAMSVILQVTSFKWTGKRIFKMAPFHHHLQLSGLKESKIITRFWILGIIFALLTLTTLKLR